MILKLRKIWSKATKVLQTNPLKSYCIIFLLIWYYFSLPKPLFNTPFSTVVNSKEGILLGATIANDQQWRFPETNKIPPKFKQCILQFEDAYFYKHPGFNPISMAKAMWFNLHSKNGKRGGSTITQQVIRLARKGQKRSYLEKIIELIQATRLEFRYSKDKILQLYTTYAPFGGNTVGLETASWRYFNRKTSELSWGESALLAVLPNAPSLLFPGKNEEKLRKKRNRLLKKLYQQRIIDSLTYTLAKDEPLPSKPLALPQHAPHFTQKIKKEHPHTMVHSTLQFHYQKATNEIVKRHHNELEKNEIHNIAVLILDIDTKEVVAYIGNSPTDKNHQNAVNIMHKPRSTGSILKPFLYTALYGSGKILPKSLVPDIPLYYKNYQPINFDKSYSGAVPSHLALSRSLNIPAVYLLQQMGIEKFHHYLTQLKLTDINRTPKHYGLSLVLGGAESNLWDLSSAYMNLSATLNHFNSTSGEYYTHEFTKPTYFKNKPIQLKGIQQEPPIFDAGSIFNTYESLKNVVKPTEFENWNKSNYTQPIAWKTGTSFGFRDAWAIGTTSKYVVGVWVGNADGEGRPGLIGLHTAAPLLFEIFAKLPVSSWFQKPFDSLKPVITCLQSGFKASKLCKNTQEEWVSRSENPHTICPYHQLVHLDRKTGYQVNTSCSAPNDFKQSSWFVLPPLMAHFYKQNNPTYLPLPPFKTDCYSVGEKLMEFIYPQIGKKIILPKGFNEVKNEIVLKATHSQTNSKLYWYLDQKLIGETQNNHEISITPKPGSYILTITDSYGNLKQRDLEVVN